MNTHKYDDIIRLPRHISPRRSPMSLYDRAAQFAPFAALTGYDEVIAETGRLTDSQILLDEGAKELLDEKLRLLRLLLPQRPLVTFCYFQPDRCKEGGAYLTIQGHVKKIDPIDRCLVLEEGDALKVDGIYAMDWEDLPLDGERDIIEESFAIFQEEMK